MSGVFGNPWLYNPTLSFYAHSIDQSLRFDNETSSQFLSFTPSSEGNRRTWTISFWVKRAELGAVNKLFGAGSTFASNHNNAFYMWFQADDTIRIRNEVSGSYYTRLDTTRFFRDVSAWYHIVYIYDSTQSTDTDRQKLYVNGVQETAFDNRTDPSSNQVSKVNQTHVHLFGKTTSSTLNAYLAEINFLDGLAYDPSYFGETKDGVWIPKQYPNNGTTSHGQNGFHLTFIGTGTATTSEGTTAQLNIGDDQSGNGNNFASTATVHSDTSTFVSSDVVPDTPTNNFCTLNPLTHGTYPTLKEGNLSIKTVYSADLSGVATTWFRTSGKWYWEIHNENASSTYPYLGITDQRQILTNTTKGSFYTVAWLRNGNSAAMTGTNTYMGTITKNNVTSWTNNDIIMFALDVDARKLWIGKNGTWDSSGDPAAGSGEDASWTVDTAVSPVFMGYSNQGVDCVFNFGQDGTFAGNLTGGNIGTATDDNNVGAFKYAPPTGFLAMANSNLPEATIGPEGDSLSTDHFNTVLFTGNGEGAGSPSSQSVTGVGFQPDWVWIKQRTDETSNQLYDAIRGVTKGIRSDRTENQYTNTNTLTSFDSDGFTVGTANAVNGNNDSLVAWNWKAGGATPTKTYKVHVESDGGQNKYRFRNSADDATFATYAPALQLQEGGTYVFDWSHSTAQAHPIRFSTTSDGTHGGGTEYTTGVVKDDTAYKTTITVAASAPTLYYYCQYHSGMGGLANTHSTFGSSNFDGTTQSITTENTDGGFSIVQYEGLSSGTQTVGHSLNSVPELIIFKNIDDTSSWVVYSEVVGTGGFLLLNSSGNTNTSDVANTFNSTAPTNSVFTVGTNNAVGGSGETIIAYCFHSVSGHCKVGKFRGNGSTNGVFVHTGFSPSIVFWKNTTSSNSWFLMDIKRDIANVRNTFLRPNTDDDENTAANSIADFLSNGFKLRGSGGDVNTSGNTYLYLAYAEAPQKFSNAQ